MVLHRVFRDERRLRAVPSPELTIMVALNGDSPSNNVERPCADHPGYPFYISVLSTLFSHHL